MNEDIALDHYGVASAIQSVQLGRLGVASTIQSVQLGRLGASVEEAELGSFILVVL
jgi:hypothetical protein